MSLAKLLSPRACELGKIKIGGLGEERQSKAGSPYRMPVKYDHFVITTLYRDTDGKLREDAALMESLCEHAEPDGKLRALPVALLSNDIDEVLQAAFLWYDGKKVAARSDGETLTKYADFKTGHWLPKPETLPWKPEYADLKDGNGNPRFKLHCTMSVVIASREAKWGGFYKFRTTSRITADQLYGSLVQLRQLTGGILRGLPLRLVVRPLQVAPNGKPTTIHVVHVELSGSDVTAIQKRALEIAQFEVSNAKQLQAAQAEYRQLLRAPDEFTDDEEEADVAQEFAPHQQPGALAPAAKEGEQRADPTAQTANAPSAGASAATAATTPATAGTDADDGIPKAGQAIVSVILPLMHALDLSWPEIRDGAEGKGKEIAEAAALPKMPAGAKVTDLSATEAMRLRAELETRVAAKKASAAKRQENAARNKAREEDPVPA